MVFNMQLFKRLLLSYFPGSLAKDSFNPASMFISFISAKDFFTVIDRKIIENYKLNLFDISMDVFEGKLWLWSNKDMMQSKLSDAYYSYLSAANFNWYKFYNVWNTANALTLLSALYFYDAFSDVKGDGVFVDALYAFYLLSFLFASRIKTFPWESEESDFNRFVDLYFNFYEIIISQLKHKISKKSFQDIKTKMLIHIEIFFMMFYYEKRVSCLYMDLHKNNLMSGEFYQWLFWSHPTEIQKRFIINADAISVNSKIWDIEQNLLFEFAPADIHLKYLFLWTDTDDVVSSLISNIFDKKILDKKLALLVKNEKELDFIIDYVTDPDNLKKGFFKWMKQYISHLRIQDQDAFDELDEMMSEIWDDVDKLNQMQIPASIKKESRIVEQFLNFYVTYIGWLSFSRANTFFLNLFKPGLLDEILDCLNISDKGDINTRFLNIVNLFYLKNQAYYQFVDKKIRSWKEKFFIPATPIKIESNNITSYIHRAQNKSALSVLLQDCNPQIWKLYVKNKALLDWFQAQYQGQISSFLKLNNDDFVYQYYEPLFSHFDLWNNILQILKNAFTDQDVIRLKNSLYAFDVELFNDVLSMFPWSKFRKVYSEVNILEHLALLRETLFWFLIYYKYLQLAEESESSWNNLNLSLLKRVYILQILNWDISLFSAGSQLVDTLIEQYWTTFTLFVEFDDNKEFFAILRENWIDFLKKQWRANMVGADKQWWFSIEDLLWLRWVLKNITYYNKRYLIPS